MDRVWVRGRGSYTPGSIRKCPWELRNMALFLGVRLRLRFRRRLGIRPADIRVPALSTAEMIESEESYFSQPG